MLLAQGGAVRLLYFWGVQCLAGDLINSPSKRGCTSDNHLHTIEQGISADQQEKKAMKGKLRRDAQYIDKVPLDLQTWA